MTTRSVSKLRPVRRWCECCGGELPPQTGKGRPRSYCAPETGRPCVLAAQLFQKFRAAIFVVLRNVPGSVRETTVRAFRSQLRQLTEDLTLEAAELDGDVQRAAAVGCRTPAGFTDADVPNRQH